MASRDGGAGRDEPQRRRRWETREKARKEAVRLAKGSAALFSPQSIFSATLRLSGSFLTQVFGCGHMLRWVDRDSMVNLLVESVGREDR
jgi:hypothetical protein